MTNGDGGAKADDAAQVRFSSKILCLLLWLPGWQDLVDWQWCFRHGFQKPSKVPHPNQAVDRFAFLLIVQIPPWFIPPKSSPTPAFVRFM